MQKSVVVCSGHLGRGNSGHGGSRKFHIFVFLKNQKLTSSNLATAEWNSTFWQLVFIASEIKSENILSKVAKAIFCFTKSTEKFHCRQRGINSLVTDIVVKAITMRPVIVFYIWLAITFRSSEAPVFDSLTHTVHYPVILVGTQRFHVSCMQFYQIPFPSFYLQSFLTLLYLIPLKLTTSQNYLFSSYLQ